MTDILDNAIDLTDIPKAEWREKYIGDGYRSCCYRTVTDTESTPEGNRNGRPTDWRHGEGRIGQIILFGYDKNDNPQTFICPWKSHIKYNVKYKTSERDIFDRYVETKYFNNTKQRKSYISACGDSFNVIECFPPENEFLHEMFDSVALDDNFNKQTLRIHYFDIETEISESFEYPKTARNRINMMTIYDTLTEKYYTWSLQHCEKNFDDELDENGNIINESPIKDLPKDRFVVYEFYNNEKNMLRHFVNWFGNNYPDVWCGFNSQAYDIPYLVNRIERVLGNPENVDNFDTMQFSTLSNITKSLSPVGNVRVRKNNLDNERANKQAEIVVDIDGIFLADELILYRDKYKINQPLDGGNGLDNIGEVELGAHKIHYKGTLKELYENQWNKFFFYNIIDVNLLKRIEEKVKLIPLSRSITSSGLSNYGAIYSSIGYLIGSLSMFSKTQLKTTFTSYNTRKNEPIPFEGAFVFPPTVGIYRGGIATVDFNSLYPSSIRATNVSPETYVGKISRYPIEDPKMEFFAKESPIDLYGSDTTKGKFVTEDEKEFTLRYGGKIGDVDDSKIEKFYLLTANGSGQKVITRTQLDKLLDEKCIFTRNNTLFLKHSVKQGVVSFWCKHFYALRKSTKKEMQRLELAIYKKQVAEDKIAETESLIDNLNAKQQAIKIMLNSIYGCLSTPFSPIYNVYIAQSITRTGRWCNTSSCEFIRKRFKEMFGIGDDYTIVSSGDTDTFLKTSKIHIKR